MSTTDRLQYFPTTGDIRAVFVEEIASLGGTVPDVYDDEERLFARAVLPVDADILPGDRVRGGVAVRVTGPELLVHPYTFRQVCSNGAIAAQAIDTRRLERMESTGVLVPTYEASVTLTDFRLAVQACAAREAFTTVTNEMRSATQIEADMALHLMPILARMPGNMAAEWVPQIFHRFTVATDRSVFGLMNAVTSVARDTRDPEARWRLEDLGGSIPARLAVRPKIAPTAAMVVGA